MFITKRLAEMLVNLIALFCSYSARRCLVWVAACWFPAGWQRTKSEQRSPHQGSEKNWHVWSVFYDHDVSYDFGFVQRDQSHNNSRPAVLLLLRNVLLHLLPQVMNQHVKYKGYCAVNVGRYLSGTAWNRSLIMKM